MKRRAYLAEKKLIVLRYRPARKVSSLCGNEEEVKWTFHFLPGKIWWLSVIPSTPGKKQLVYKLGINGKYKKRIK